MLGLRQLQEALEVQSINHEGLHACAIAVGRARAFAGTFAGVAVVEVIDYARSKLHPNNSKFSSTHAHGEWLA